MAHWRSSGGNEELSWCGPTGGRGWKERLIISVLNFCETNLFNFVFQRKCTGVQSHYFDVWEPTQQGNPDAA
jgi:hypothetical protein